MFVVSQVPHLLWSPEILLYDERYSEGVTSWRTCGRHNLEHPEMDAQWLQFCYVHKCCTIVRRWLLGRVTPSRSFGRKKLETKRYLFRGVGSGIIEFELRWSTRASALNISCQVTQNIYTFSCLDTDSHCDYYTTTLFVTLNLSEVQSYPTQ